MNLGFIILDWAWGDISESAHHLMSWNLR